METIATVLLRAACLVAGGLLLVAGLGLALTATAAPRDGPAAAAAARTLTPEAPGLPGENGGASTRSTPVIDADRPLTLR